MGFYYFDYTYLLFLAPAIIITMIAQIGVKTTFNQYSKVLNMKGLTGAAAAQRVLEHGGSLLTQVQMLKSQNRNGSFLSDQLGLIQDQRYLYKIKQL